MKKIIFALIFFSTAFAPIVMVPKA